MSVQAQSAYPPYVAGRNFMEAGWNSVKSNLGVTMIANWTCWPSKLNGIECAQLDKMHCTELVDIDSCSVLFCFRDIFPVHFVVRTYTY